MAALRYRRFLKLCEEWPVDETRRGRDLGAFLRQRVAQVFKEGENTQIDKSGPLCEKEQLVLAQIQDPDACDQMYESLSRLNSSYYREKYPRLQDTSFTEITVDEYRMVLATDNLKQMDEMKKGMWKRLKDKFNVKAPQDEVKE